MVVEDSQATPQQGVVAMNKLVSVEKVPFVLSAFTGVSKAIAPVGDKAKVVSVNGGGIAPDLAELGEYFWNVIPLANFEVQAITPYLVKERGWKKMALVYVDDPAGEAIKSELGIHVPKNGGTLVAELQVPARVAAVLRHRGQGARGAARRRLHRIVRRPAGTDHQAAARQRRQAAAGRLLGFSVPSVPQLPEAKGALFPTQAINWNADALSRRLAADWKAKKGKVPNAYVANYYNAVLVFAKLAQALEKAGQPITGEGLLTMRKQTTSFDVVGGR